VLVRNVQVRGAEKTCRVDKLPAMVVLHLQSLNSIGDATSETEHAVRFEKLLSASAMFGCCGDERVCGLTRWRAFVCANLRRLSCRVLSSTSLSASWPTTASARVQTTGTSCHTRVRLAASGIAVMMKG
jgi:hypothetical protein